MLVGESYPLVHPRAINNRWPEIAPLLERVADPKVTLDDIYTFCMDGTWVLWVRQDPETSQVTDVAVTEFIEYPQVHNLRVIFLSGNDQDWSSGIDIFEKYAGINQCHAIEVHGRKGWERVLKNRGFGLDHITLSKRIL